MKLRYTEERGQKTIKLCYRYLWNFRCKNIWKISIAFMRQTLRMISVRYYFPLPLQKNILMPVRCGRGNGCSLKHVNGGTKKRASRWASYWSLGYSVPPAWSRFTVWYSEANRLSRVTSLICNASTRSRLRYPYHTRASRSQRCFNHYVLHPRPQSRRSRHSKSYRPDMMRFSLFSEDRPNLPIVYLYE